MAGGEGGDDEVGERPSRSQLGHAERDDESELYHKGRRALDGLLQVER